MRSRMRLKAVVSLVIVLVAFFPTISAAQVLLSEDFEGTFPPNGWTVVNNVAGGSWESNVTRGVPNFCKYGDGDCAVAHPGDTNTTFWDTELRSPEIDLTNAVSARLTYASMFQDYAGNGEIWVDISTDGGTTWTNLRHQTDDDPPGGTPALGGTSEWEDLSPYLGSTVVLRWRYQASNSPAWCFHVDNVKVEARSTPATILLSEKFEGTFPPTDWTVVNNVAGGIWESNATRGVPNYCYYGDGDCAVAHPGDANTVSWDTELRSPEIDLTNTVSARLTYASMFQNYAGNGELWVDISTDGGTTWTNLRNQTDDDPPGGTPALGGTSEWEDLSTYLGSTVVLRWRYQASNSPAWCFHVDNVKVEAYPIIPEIISISPDAGPVEGGNLVVIAGKDLTSGVQVAFDGQPAQIDGTTPGSRYLIVIPPPHDAGSVDVSVTYGSSTYTATDSYTYTLESRELRIDKTGTGAGKVVSDPPGIDCGLDCHEYYALDRAVTLTGTPDAGSALDGWSGADCKGAGPCTLTMNRDVLVAAVFNPDGDADGVSDRVEDAGPNNGDGNDDGTLDSLQKNAASFPSVEGGYMTLVVPDGMELAGVYSANPPASADLPTDIDFPLGAVRFQIKGVAIGGKVEAKLIIHDSYAPINAYYKYGAAPENASDHWYDFALSGDAGADIATEDGKTVIRLSFVDGGRGDVDLKADGVVTDPGAPAVESEPSTGGGSGGGCFILNLL